MCDGQGGGGDGGFEWGGEGGGDSVGQGRVARGGGGEAGRGGGGLGDVKEAAEVAGARIEPFVCDVADAVAVEAMAAGVRNSLGVATVLVNSAGTNAPRRSWEVLSVETFEEIVN